jgi:aminoglycoside phosphotransferase (APT) family kinase protein
MGGAAELADIDQRLQCFLRAQLPAADRLRVEGLHRTSAGLSRENWVFDAEWREAGHTVREALILRRDPVGSVLETDRRVEFAVLAALEHTDVPAPRVRWLDADGDWLGRPSVVMVREPGECEYFVLDSERALARRVTIAERYCDVLASIHRVDWRTLGLGAHLPEPGARGAAHAAVDHWEGELRRHQLEAHPELELVVAWLRANVPAAPATVLVHGDYKPGNALMRGDDIAVILDWETAHLGDPLEDIGWVTNPVRAREHQIVGAWQPSDLFARYEQQTGFTVDPGAVRWWNVLANYKLSVITLTGVRAFVDDRLDRAHQVPVGLFRAMVASMEG